MCLERVKGSVYLFNPCNHLEVSTYLVNGEKRVIIDPGPCSSIDRISRCLKDSNLQNICYIALTHIHLDHGGGSWRLLETLSDAKIYVHPKGAPHLIKPTKLEESARSLLGKRVDDYGEIKGIPHNKIINSKDGEDIDLDGVKIKAIWTPGHASHHQCFFIPEERILILGDAGGIYSQKRGTLIPTAPPPFNPIKAMDSLDKLISLESEILCYGHHGCVSNGVVMLRRHKRQIHLWSSIVEGGLEENLSPEEIYEKIKDEDPMINKETRFTSETRERSPLITLQGFIGYYKWINSINQDK